MAFTFSGEVQTIEVVRVSGNHRIDGYNATKICFHNVDKERFVLMVIWGMPDDPPTLNLYDEGSENIPPHETVNDLKVYTHYNESLELIITAGLQESIRQHCKRMNSLRRETQKMY